MDKSAADLIIIEKIMLGLSSIFTKVNFDIGTGMYGNNMSYEIYVDDYEFYMHNEVYRKVINRYREKYPNVDFICFYKKFKI